MAALGALALLACSSGKKLTKEESCQEKWDKVRPKFEKKKYVQSKELLSDLVTTCPGSPFTEEAMFDLGEAHYNLEEWEEAARTQGVQACAAGIRKFGKRHRAPIKVRGPKEAYRLGNGGNALTACPDYSNLANSSLARSVYSLSGYKDTTFLNSSAACFLSPRRRKQ